MKKCFIFFFLAFASILIPAIFFYGNSINNLNVNFQVFFKTQTSLQTKINKNAFFQKNTVTLFESFPEKVKIIMNCVSVYESANLNSNTIGNAFFKEIFNVIAIEENFYKIEYNSTIGYILTAYAMDFSISSPIINLDTNASLIRDSYVYEYNNEQHKYEIVEDIKLKANTRIKILSGYNLNKEYCKVSFQVDEEILTFYILTTNILTDGINSRTIIAITLIVVCITIFLILYSFFRGKKKQNIEFEFKE